jgi:hypothetical protein
MDVTGPCSSGSIDIPFLGIEVPECPHYEISIEGPSCAPDCIQPGTAIVFDIGGTLSASVYPTIVTFNVYNEADNSLIYSQSWTVNNDTELDAISVTMIAPEPGSYYAEICIPGCNSIRRLNFTVCEPFDIYKDSCNHWHVHRPWNDNRTDYIVNISELEGDALVVDTLWDTSQEETFAFEVPGDGIYIFTMSDPVTGAVIYSFAAFETCDLLECWKNLMERIMCSCADPCCKKCSGSAQAEREFARMTLNKLVPLFTQYLAIAKHWNVSTYGLNFVDEDRMCFLMKANQLFDRIQDLTSDCGCKCNEQSTTATSRGDCSTC